MGIGVNAYRFQRNVTLDAASVPANTLQAETFTVAGLKVAGAPVVVNKPTNESGLALVSYRCSANDTLELVFFNATGSAINPASQSYKVVQL